MLLYSTIRLVVDDLPTTRRKMIWLVLAETSSGPAVVSDAEFKAFVPLIRQLLRVLDISSAPSPLHLRLYLVELVDVRGLRVSGDEEHGGVFQKELAEREADDLASVFEGIAARVRDALPNDEDGTPSN